MFNVLICIVGIHVHINKFYALHVLSILKQNNLD